MKTLQNIYIRGKALITREQNRQLEQFHKRMFNEHGGGHGTGGATTAHATGKFIQQRSRQILRPFQNLLSVSILNAAARYAIIHKPFIDSMMSEQLLLENLEISADSSIQNSGIIVPSDSDYTGLLEIFNEPAPGKKQFCGKQIDTKFYHVLEYAFPFAWMSSGDDSASVYSEIIEDTEDVQIINPARIRRGADNLMNLSLVKSEIELSVTDEEYMYSSYYNNNDEERMPALQIQ